jgi:hypothetical protein
MFLELAGIGATLTDHEAPDFVLDGPNIARVGLEITSLVDGDLRMSAETRKDAERLAASRLDAPLGVMLAWNGDAVLPRPTAATLAERIAAAAARVRSGEQPHSALVAVGLSHEVGSLAVWSEEDAEKGTFVHGSVVTTLRQDAGAIQQCLSDKELKLPRYRESVGGSPVWLVIETGNEAENVVPWLLPRDATFVSGFDRVYLLDEPVRELRRLMVLPAAR